MSIKKLIDLRKNGISFHMPGHKSRLLFNGSIPLKYDVTEIQGMDNLHNAEGKILNLEERLSKLYNSYKTRILVGGSTAGILSAILGSTSPGQTVLVNRNAHRSVYNAIKIGKLKAKYFFPQICGVGVPAGFGEDFESFLKSTSPLSSSGSIDSEIDAPAAIIFTYPTYEGILYDLKSAIKSVRSYYPEAVVIVDEAHGAHLFLENPELSSISMGADIIVQSLHKTLPSLGMSAVLHFGNTVAAHKHYNQKSESINWYLGAIQSSSPSYLILVGIAEMLDIIELNGKEMNLELKKNVDAFYEKMSKSELTRGFLYSESEFGGKKRDFSKILLRLGYPQEEFLREKHNIFAEMCDGKSCLFMASICSVKEDFERLYEALVDLGKVIECGGLDLNSSVVRKECRVGEKFIDLDGAEGKISGEDIIPFPPGIPLVLEGEVIDEKIIANLRSAGYDSIRHK